MDIIREVQEIKRELVRLRCRFHEYPETAGQEVKTTAMIIEELEKAGISYTRMESTGVAASIGCGGEKTVALRADIDGLAVTEETGLGFASKRPGYMHACGHDGHTAALLAAALILKRYESRIKGRILLIFQPAEETGTGAKAVIDAGYLDGVEEIFGLHIFSDLPSGCVSVEAGPRMAATDHFTITLTGKSGHAAKPHQCIDATVAAAALVMNLQTIVSRRLDPLEDAVVTVGRLQSGTAYNIISGEAVLEGTVRTFSMDTEDQIKHHIIEIAKNTAHLYGAEAEIEYPQSMHPPLINDPEIAGRMQTGLKEVFDPEQMISVPKMMLGEDFSNYLLQVPGVFAFVGGGRTDDSETYPNHHSKFDFTEEALVSAVKLHLTYVESVFGKI